MDLGRPASCEDESLFMCSRLYMAAFKGHTEVVTRLLTGSSAHAQAAASHRGPCTVQEVTAEGNPLLQIAAGQGHGGLIAELCYRDSSLHSSVNKALDTPLHSAARAGSAHAVEAIVWLARADVDADRLRGVIRGKNVAGDTALHLAARHGHCMAVEKLMNLAPELASELNGAGVSPLYLAVTSGLVDAVRAIVSYGDADVSAAGPNMQNALHAAVLHSSG